MGSGASKKKKVDDSSEKDKRPEWTDSSTHSIALPGPEYAYTGFAVMGLAQFKPHVVGKLTYTHPDLGEEEADLGAGDDKQSIHRVPSLKSAVSRVMSDKSQKTRLTGAIAPTEITRAPSDKSARSNWSKVKSTVENKSLRSHVAKAEDREESLAGKTQGSAAHADFARVPSHAGSQISQAKSAKSRWSDLRSHFSAESGVEKRSEVEEKMTSWEYVGEFREGKKHGLGVQTHENGKSYAGEWHEGEMHGWGVLTRKDGSVYRGQFEHGVFCGNGAEIRVSPEQDHGYQPSDPTRLFLSFEGPWTNGRRNGRGVAGRVRCLHAGSVQGLVQVEVVRYAKGVLMAADTQPLANNKGKFSTLLQELMDVWAQASFTMKQALEQQKMVQKLMLDRAAAIFEKQVAAEEAAKALEEDVVLEDVEEEVPKDEKDEVGKEDEKGELGPDPDLDLTEAEISQELIGIWKQIKHMCTEAHEAEEKKEIIDIWQKYAAAQHDVEMEALALQKEREEAEERARLLEIERQEALARLVKAQTAMADAKTTQLEAMGKMKEAKALRARAQKAKDEKMLLEMQLVSLKEDAVSAVQALQHLEEKELTARERFDENEVSVNEVAKQLQECQRQAVSMERNVRRLTQEYELGRDQLRVQAANSLTFHQVKQVFEKHDADGSGELEHAEIKLALEDLGLPSTGAAVDRFIQQLDKDCTGTLDWQEFQQLARKTEEDNGEAGKLLKSASETEKELKAALNRAIASMMTSSSNLASAQLKVKAAQLSYNESQTSLEQASAQLLECTLAEERARLNQQAAESKIQSLGEEIVVLEATSKQISEEAAEAAATAALAYEDASLLLMAAERGEKEVTGLLQDAEARKAVLEAARQRAQTEMEENTDDAGKAAQASIQDDASRIAWIKDYETPLSTEEAEQKAVRERGGIEGFRRAASLVKSAFSRANSLAGPADASQHPRTVEVTVVKGLSLIAKDMGGTSDPFVEVHFNQQKLKTKVVKQTVNPLWNETLKFELGKGVPTPVMTLVVYDEDKGFFMGTSAEYMGSCDITLDGLGFDEVKQEWHDLKFDAKYQKKEETITGRLMVKVKMCRQKNLASLETEEMEQEKINGVDYIYKDRRAKYCGEFKEGMRWGQGKLTLYSSALPKGATVLFAGEQVPTEPGGLCLGEKAFYEGQWQNDVPNGLGVMIDTFHGRYQGAWKRGLREGNGHFRDAAGKSYQGKWKDNSRNGSGTETLPSGERYEGDFQNSLRHGKGVTTRGETYTHTGAWRRGKMHGKGTLEEDGMRYVGEFKNGERTGKAHIFYSEFLEYKGEVLRGKRQGSGVMLFEDDRRYNGEWVNDEMEGYGVLTYPNGNEYNGPFKNGKRHGPKGSLEMPELEGCSARYIGDFHEDRIEGKGSVEWQDGRKYEGQFQDGIRFGHGVMTFKDGAKYDGNWIDGKRSGMGTLSFADGGKYTGLFHDNVRHGRGTMEKQNGEELTGEWVNDKMHGKGTLTYADGSTYEGEFVEGFMSGRGEFKSLQGKQYVGEWAQDMREGRGDEIDEGGRTYSGLFHLDKRHGDGVWTWPNGHVYEGMWSKGEKHGHGKERIPADMWGKTWTEFEGEFKHGQEKLGKGRFVYANGDVYDGRWHLQRRHGFGRFEAADGYFYEGAWIDDLKSGIGEEVTTTGNRYQGEFHNDKRHGMGTEISAKGDQYIGEFFKGERCGEGKAFDNKTGSRYEGEFVGDVQHGFGSMIHRAVVDKKSTWITYLGEWREGVKHGDGVEVDARNLAEEDATYFCGEKRPYDPQSLIFRNPSLTLSETSKEMRDAINEMLYNLRQTVHDEQLREEWVWRLERKLCDDNEGAVEFRNQIFEHGGVPIICELLQNDTDDLAQLKGGQLLFFMSRTVNFSGLAASIVECKGAVAGVVGLLDEPTSEPRIYSCAILEALCKDKEFARLSVCEGAVSKLVALIRNPGWLTLKGKGYAALALKNIGHHQRAIVSVELGLPVVTGGFGFNAQKNDVEKHNIEEAIRKILIAAGAGPAAMALN